MNREETMNTMKKGLTAVSALGLVALLAGPASADDVDCDNETITAPRTNDNINVVNTCDIPNRVNGNIFVGDGATLNLTGKVNGNIEATGTGVVNLGDEALVRSDVKHDGSGTVNFNGAGDGAIVRGNV